MPATADAAGRIKCQTCENTLWFLTVDDDGVQWIVWNAHVRGGQIRPIRFRADHRGLNSISVTCERCGECWVPQPLNQVTPIRAPRVSGVLKPVSA